MPAATSLPPGPRAARATQSCHFFVRPVSYMETGVRRHGDPFTGRFVPDRTLVFLANPASIKEAFTASPDVVHAGEANAQTRPLFGRRSLFLLDGERHLRERRLMLPPWHGSRIQRYEPLIEEVIDEELRRWPLRRPFELLPHMHAVTLEVILRALFGRDARERLGPLRETLRRGLGSNARVLGFFARGLATDPMPETGPLGRLRRAILPIDSLLMAEIERRRSDPALADRGDILSVLLQARFPDGSPLGDLELRDELRTLIIAGHESTSTTITWTIERLLRHPEALERAREEARAGGRDYIDAAVHESMRLRPVVPIVARKLAAPLELSGYELPAGTEVLPCVYLVHRNPDVYPDPAAFRPERFLDRPADSYSWIPFGGGVRRCVGAPFALFEMKTVLAAVLRRATLALEQPENERIVRRALTFAPSLSGRVVLEALAP